MSSFKRKWQSDISKALKKARAKQHVSKSRIQKSKSFANGVLPKSKITFASRKPKEGTSKSGKRKPKQYGVEEEKSVSDDDEPLIKKAAPDKVNRSSTVMHSTVVIVTESTGSPQKR